MFVGGFVELEYMKMEMLKVFEDFKVFIFDELWFVVMCGVVMFG